MADEPNGEIWIAKNGMRSDEKPVDRKLIRKALL